MSPSFSSMLSLLALSFSSTVLAANHNIRVGPGLTFTPANTIAAPADTLTFLFAAAAHDVAAGSFSAPCSPLAASTAGSFYSGIISTSSTSNNTFVVTVNTTAPIYYYCSVSNHCQAGMVGGVNVPTNGTQTLALYNTTSKATTSSTKPNAMFGGVVRAGALTNTTTNSTTSSSMSSSMAATSTSTRASSTSSASASASATVKTTSGAVSSVQMGSTAGLLIAGLIAMGALA